MNTEKLTPEVARKIEKQMIAALGGMPDGLVPYDIATRPSIRLNKRFHKVHPCAAHLSGVKAKRQGMGRLSPYYEASGSDHFWFAGYDGKTLQEAVETQ